MAPETRREHFRFSPERRITKIVRGKDGKWQRDRKTLADRITNKTDAQTEAERVKVGIKDGSLLEGVIGRPVLG